MKLISIIHNLTNGNAEINQFLIIFNANGHSTYLNDWQDEHYFIRSFTTLFLYGDGGHLAKWKTIISLQSWANWFIGILSLIVSNLHVKKCLGDNNY